MPARQRFGIATASSLGAHTLLLLLIGLLTARNPAGTSVLIPIELTMTSRGGEKLVLGQGESRQTPALEAERPAESAAQPKQVLGKVFLPVGSRREDESFGRAQGKEHGARAASLQAAMVAASTFRRQTQHLPLAEYLQCQAHRVEIQFAAPYGDRTPCSGQGAEDRVLPDLGLSQTRDFTWHQCVQE